ncbi:hypothetical protein K469DRAFT_732291 [Zopfia rhizophila CBS 207.26]|uniref:Uncharacterized protein n=1 Tax=Zopfia rhizophila CBS 207.26 TaxID=1314779 RepID=A0A6A6DHD0_9PEZI|nr:hypothetical protein K469DRAFT_732291 [Zopfia rhizophila CBS 207.26]
MESLLPSSSIPQCCCGSKDCPFLAHNSTLLEGLERDVHKAAQLGQALLVRHEAYVADSERERQQMTTTIENLEKEKLELEERNAQTIKTNRDLLDQLEQLNDAVAESDAQVKALTDTLHSTEEEIQRLSALAARTQSLERQIIDLEREQEQLQGTLDTKVGDERTAIQRWRRAEKTIGDLQDQIDRIEKETREERERHAEIVGRMERRMAVDGELATAAGRLKAKASHEKAGTSVVSHFVKDILLDNANLQHGILELREMLLNSNEEVEHLREQLRVHQPISPTEEDALTPTVQTPTLQKELGSEPVFSQQLHIHHHYHGPAQRKEAGPKAQPHRRTRKKRHGITSGHFTPPVPPSLSTPATILAQTSATLPPNPNRWSNATTLVPSSLPSSPLSMSHRGSFAVFSDVAYDSSRPTSPSESIDSGSPVLLSAKSKYGIVDDAAPQKRNSAGLQPPSLTPLRSISSPMTLTAKSSPATAIITSVSPQNSLSNEPFTLSPSLHSTIPEENEDTSTLETALLTSPVPPTFNPGSDSIYSSQRPALRRPASHESLISISGMDIHTLQSRPSQLLLSSSPCFASSSGATSSKPVLTPWTATATSNMSRRNLDSSTFNKSLLYNSSVNQKRGTNPNIRPRKSEQTLGKKVGEWVFGKWGATPSRGSDTRPGSKNSAQTNDSKGSTASTVKKSGVMEKDGGPVKLRPPGVNQSGPIWGFFDKVPETPSQVTVTNFDEEALREAVAEG